MSRVIFDPWPGTATEADVVALVERDKRLCELIDGTLVEKPMGYWEGIIAQTVGHFLNAHVIPRGLGVVSGADSTMRMASNRVRMPDVGFTATARVPRTREPIPTLAPDLAVEVLSEGNTRAEMAQKLREYFASGTRLAWIVDPGPRTVAVYDSPERPTRVLTEADALDGGDVLPGFALPVADVFRGVPPLG